MNMQDKIMRLRKAQGLSQEELGNKINVSRQAVSKWESGQSIPDIEKIIQLSDVFNVTTDYLLKDETEASEKCVSNRNFKSQIGTMVFVAYCGILVAVYFLLSIMFKAWNITWIIFIAGGVLMPLIIAICNYFVNKNSNVD